MNKNSLVDSRLIKHIIRSYKEMSQNKVPLKKIIETLKLKYGENLPPEYKNAQEIKRKPNKGEIEAIIKEFEYFYTNN